VTDTFRCFNGDESFNSPNVPNAPKGPDTATVLVQVKGERYLICINHFGVSPRGKLFFQSPDCTGTPYIEPIAFPLDSYLAAPRAAVLGERHTVYAAASTVYVTQLAVRSTLELGTPDPNAAQCYNKNGEVIDFPGLVVYPAIALADLDDLFPPPFTVR
jgi:hypothetical protein